MSTDNPRFNAGQGTVALYAAAPVDAPWPSPLTPTEPYPFIPNPLTPGIHQPPPGMASPPFTEASGGQEPIDQILSRVRARIEWLKAEITRLDVLRAELARLERMVAVQEEP